MPGDELRDCEFTAKSASTEFGPSVVTKIRGAFGLSNWTSDAESDEGWGARTIVRSVSVLSSETIVTHLLRHRDFQVPLGWGFEA